MNGNQANEYLNADTKLALINLRILVLNIQLDTIEELLHSEGLDPDEKFRALDAIKEYSELLANLKKQKVKLENCQMKSEGVDCRDDK